MVVMRIGDIGVSDRYPVLLHGGHVGEGYRGRHAVEAGEAVDGVAVQVQKRRPLGLIMGATYSWPYRAW